MFTCQNLNHGKGNPPASGKLTWVKVSYLLSIPAGMNACKKFKMTKMSQDTSSENYTSVQKNAHGQHLSVVSFFLDNPDLIF